MEDMDGKRILAEKEIMLCEEEMWQIIILPCELKTEKTAIYFKFEGKGEADMKSFGFCLGN